MKIAKQQSIDTALKCKQEWSVRVCVCLFSQIPKVPIPIENKNYKTNEYNNAKKRREKTELKLVTAIDRWQSEWARERD